MFERVFFTYNDVDKMCVKIAEAILADVDQGKMEYPERIVGIVRGGTVPAVILSHMLEIPCVMLAYSSNAGKGDKNSPNILDESITAGLNQLFVDDICDSGNTMHEIDLSFHTAEARATSRFASVVYRQHNKSIFTPSYSGITISDERWVVFPWEHIGLGSKSV